MKLAILSDIHGNIFALKEVYKNALSRGVKQFINLGDIFYGPIAPKETYDFLKDKDFITISGNQDRFLLEAKNVDIRNNLTLEFVINELGIEGLEWLKNLNFDVELDKDIYACHGSPRDDEEYLLEDKQTAFTTVKSIQKIDELLYKIKSNIILCGHSHIPRMIETTKKLIINPGSVGLPAYDDEIPLEHTMQNYSSHASYAILEKSEFGCNVDFIRVAYDIKSAIQCAQKRQREDWAHYLKYGRGVKS